MMIARPFYIQHKRQSDDNANESPELPFPPVFPFSPALSTRAACLLFPLACLLARLLCILVVRLEIRQTIE